MRRQGRGIAGRTTAARRFPTSILARMRRRRTAGSRVPRPSRTRRARIRLSGRHAASTAPRWSEAEAEAAQCGVDDPRGAAGGRAGSRSSTMRPPWRAGSACLSSPGTPSSTSAVQRTGAPAEAGLPARSTGGRAACWPRRRPRPRHCSATWRRCAAQGIDVALAPQLLIDAALEVQTRPERLDRAVRGLLREQPASSAGSAGCDLADRSRRRGTVGLLIGGFIVLPDATLAALTALIALPFLCVTLLRLVALRQALAEPGKQGARRRNPAARSRPAAAGLHRAGAAVPRGQRAARPDPVAARARLSAGQARDLPGPRDGRHRDPGGGAATGAARQFPLAGRAGRRAADQAQGVELCAAVRARRFRRGLRCRGPAAARPAAPRAGTYSAGRRPASSACRRSSTSTIRARAG